MKVFSVDGYFNDDKSEFTGYLVAEYDQTPVGYSDEDIFHYGVSEKDLLGIHDDFTITSYEVVE